MGNLTAGNMMLIACVLFFIVGTAGAVRNAVAGHKANQKRKLYTEVCKNSVDE